MGELRPDPGGPPEDGSGARGHGLPDLPPEWGTVIIPDDASELDDEATALRRELRRGRHIRLRGALGTPVGSEPQPSLGIPVVIMAVAVLTTMVSLFVVTWGRPVSVAPPSVTAASAPTVPATANGALADVVLVDSGGLRVRLSTLLPAVLLLVDGCACDQLALATAAIAPVGVQVVPVARSAPSLAAAPANMRPLTDADGVLRARYAKDIATGPGVRPR